jgi:aspartate/methionine/tyrosine aminotransferase
MNPLAEELNRTLEGTVAGELLSGFGRRIYFPKGIVAQSAEAKQHARRFNATIGMATEGGRPMSLPSIRSLIPGLSEDRIFSYAPTAGQPELREAWKQEMVRKNPALAGKLTSNPVVVAGLTHGICTVADLFAGAGDRVLVPDMFWDNYPLIFEERYQAAFRTFPFFDAKGGMDLQGLERALADPAGKKTILVLNFPNNPTGYSPTRAEAKAVVEILRKRAEGGQRMLVVLDDAYFGLFYEEGTHPHSLFADLADLHRNILAVKVDGPTKEELVWGFRIGFLTFAARDLTPDHYAALTQKLMGSIRSTVSNCNQLTQNLLLHAMRSPTFLAEKEEAFRKLKERYQAVRRIVADLAPGSALQPLPFNSGYFLTFRFKGGSAEELRKHLLHQEGIGAISIQDRFLRIAYSSVDRKDLEALFRSLFQAAGKLAGASAPA